MTDPPAIDVHMTVNGKAVRKTVPPRLTLVDFLRDEAGLTGTHVGCEQGVCGACTVLADGVSVRACLMFAVQAEGMQITTVEGLQDADGALSELQEAFWDCHALQCGYCTPAMLIAAQVLLDENPAPSPAEIRHAIGGVLCRCTGYQQIVEAVSMAARRLGGEAGDA